MEYSYSIEQRIILQAKYFKEDEQEILLAFKNFADNFKDLKGVSIDLHSLKVRNYEYDITIESRVVTIRAIALKTILKSVSIEISNNGRLYKSIDVSGKKVEELPLIKEEVEGIFVENKFDYGKVIELLMEHIFK